MKIHELLIGKLYVVAQDLPPSYCKIIYGHEYQPIPSGTVLRCSFIHPKNEAAHFTIKNFHHPKHASYRIAFAKRLEPFDPNPMQMLMLKAHKDI